MANQTYATPTSSQTRYLWLAALMAVLALFVHGYLYAQHLALESGEFTKSICDINEKFDCSAVSASKYAVVQGIPVALWGFMANVGFLLLFGTLFLTDDDKKPAARRNLMIAAVAIFAGSVVMGSISLFFLSKFCLFCMTAYVLSILLLLFTWLAFRGLPLMVGGGFVALLVTGAVAIIGAFIMNSSIAGANDTNSPQAQATFNDLVQKWQAAPPKEFKLVDPLVKGPENAKMTIVEFADFRCIHCKHAAPVIHAFVNAHPDVRLEFQPWPLDGECNSNLTQANGASCLLARASWCAQKNKQTGWAVHDYIYGLADLYPSVDAVKADLPAMANAAGMSADEMRTCTESDAAKAAVRSQADAIVIEGTPTIYVNKKLLQGGQVLQVLQKAYGTL